MKTNYLSQWETAKKDLPGIVRGTQAVAANAGEEGKKMLVKLAALQKSTGLTPILKKIDEGFQKEHRATVAAAAVELYRTRVPLSLALGSLTVAAANAGADDLVDTIKALSDGLVAIEADVTAKLKQLQNQKAGVQAEDNWNKVELFEGDFKQNVDDLKKKVKAHATVDKKHNVVKLTAPMMSFIDAYTKAASRLQAKEAHAALKGFKAAAKEAERKLTDIAAKEAEANADYAKALRSFTAAVKGMGRLDTQLALLERRLAED